MTRWTAAERARTWLGLLVLAGWIAGGESAAQGAPPAKAPETTLEQARVVESELRVVVIHGGSEPSPTIDLIVTTRAAGRLVASQRRRLAPLVPGARREERVALSVWGADQPEIRSVLLEGCCLTRVRIEPGGSWLEVRHPPP